MYLARAMKSPDLFSVISADLQPSVKSNNGVTFPVLRVATHSILTQLLSLNPSKDFSAAAHYALGLLLAKEARLREAVENLKTILEKFPDSTGESGIPLQPLAQLKLLELQKPFGFHFIWNRVGIGGRWGLRPWGILEDIQAIVFHLSH